MARMNPWSQAHYGVDEDEEWWPGRVLGVHSQGAHAGLFDASSSSSSRQGACGCRGASRGRKPRGRPRGRPRRGRQVGAPWPTTTTTTTGWRWRRTMRRRWASAVGAEPTTVEPEGAGPAGRRLRLPTRSVRSRARAFHRAPLHPHDGRPAGSVEVPATAEYSPVRACLAEFPVVQKICHQLSPRALPPHRARGAMALAALSGDEQRILFTQLCNVLDPRAAVYLSSTCSRAGWAS
eukprot:scaffold2801_cov63-Phaeocystis_antarctica.AAC.2